MRMSNREWKLLLASPTACRVIAIIFLGMCVSAVVFNIYNASGGYIGSFLELILYFGVEITKRIRSLGCGCNSSCFVD